MGRNYGIENQEDPSDFTIGFWTGAITATILIVVPALLGLWVFNII